MAARGGGSGIIMRWQSRDVREGNSETTIEAGRIYFVPIALRDERREDGEAIITNHAHLVDHQEKWRVVDDTWAFRLELRSGSTKWVSPHWYALRVPRAGVSNGHFTLQVHYPDANY